MALPTEHKFFDEVVMAGMIREYIEENLIIDEFVDIQTISDQGNSIQIIIEGEDFKGIEEVAPMEELPGVYYNEETKTIHFTRKGGHYLVSEHRLRGSRDTLAEFLKEKLGRAVLNDLQERVFKAIDNQAKLRVPLPAEGLTVDMVIDTNASTFGDEDGEVLLLINPVDWSKFRKSGSTKIDGDKTYRQDGSIDVVHTIDGVRIFKAAAVPVGKPVLTKKGAAFLYFQHDDKVIFKEQELDLTDALRVSARVYTVEGIMYPNHIVQFDGAVAPTP